jgi:hypothetical protein
MKGISRIMSSMVLANIIIRIRGSTLVILRMERDMVKVS